MLFILSINIIYDFKVKRREKRNKKSWSGRLDRNGKICANHMFHHHLGGKSLEPMTFSGERRFGSNLQEATFLTNKCVR